MKCVIACLISAWLAAPLAWLAEAGDDAAAAWPMFRGQPDLRGIAEGRLPAAFELLWQFKTKDAIKSSAAVKDGRIFVGSVDGNLYALDAGTGDKLWAVETKDVIESTPLVLDDVVYVGSGDGKLYAIAADSGKIKWHYATEDRMLGAVNWALAPGGKDKWILAGSYDSVLHCVNAADGGKIWAYTSGSYINGAPAVYKDRIVFGGCDAVVHVVSLENGEKIHAVKVGAYIAGSAAIADGRAYLGHYGNEFVCVDINAGKVVWSYRRKQFPYFSSPAVDRDRVVFGGRDKAVHCVRREDGKQLWRFGTGGRVDGSPVICGDKVVVGSESGRLFVLSLEDGSKIWSYEIGRGIVSSPAVVDGRIYIGADDGVLYAFEGSTKQ